MTASVPLEDGDEIFLVIGGAGQGGPLEGDPTYYGLGGLRAI